MSIVEGKKPNKLIILLQKLLFVSLCNGPDQSYSIITDN